MAMVPEQAIKPDAIVSLYPYFRRYGTATLAMVAADAAEDPHMAPNKAEANTAAMPNPP